MLQGNMVLILLIGMILLKGYLPRKNKEKSR
jgi:hypothetical protein